MDVHRQVQLSWYQQDVSWGVSFLYRCPSNTARAVYAAPRYDFWREFHLCRKPRRSCCWPSLLFWC